MNSVNGSSIEWVWLCIAIWGCAYAWRNKLDARDDRTRNEAADESIRYTMHVVLISSRWALFDHVVLLMMAIWAVSNPPPPPRLWEVQGFFLILACIVLTIDRMVVSRLGRQWRHRIGRGFGDRRIARHPIAGKDRRVAATTEGAKETHGSADSLGTRLEGDRRDDH